MLAMSLQQWLKENAENGISRRAARSALRGAGYSEKQIDAALVGYKPARAEPVGLTVAMVAAVVLVVLAILVGILL